MILNNAIIEDIKEKSGLLFDKAGDFSILSSLIFKETGRNIGVTTLKRLFHYIQDDRKASEYTLNTIALYVGYKSWEEYSSAKNLVTTAGSTYNMHITTDVAGDYVFTFVYDANASNMRVLVKYPCATAGQTLYKFVVNHLYFTRK